MIRRAGASLLGMPGAAGRAAGPVEPLSTGPPWLAGPLEAVLRPSHEIPIRLAAVRLAISAPRRFVELAAELARRPDRETRRAVAWNLGMIAKHRPELLDGRPPRAVANCSTIRLAVRAEAAWPAARRESPPRRRRLLAD